MIRIYFTVPIKDSVHVIQIGLKRKILCMPITCTGVEPSDQGPEVQNSLGITGVDAQIFSR